ncbi:MAG TPA: addiction module protein [Longimicrobiales bacterium]
MAKNPLFDFSKLSPTERLQLAQDLWDSVDSAAGLDVLPLSDEQREELERRLAELEANPNEGSPWPEVRDRLKSQLRNRRNPGA